jgi:outer membrane protein OmpA-like peptidoglycan-associated protein
MVAAGAAMLTTACTTYDPYYGGPQVGQPVVRGPIGPVGRNTQGGALIGAGAGAALGAIVAGRGDDLEGALIGGAVGALAGAAVGQYMDRQQEELARELAGTGIDVQRQGDNIVLNMPGDITFAFDRSDIQPQFNPVLDDVGRTLAQYNQTTVEVTGHADSTGADAYNQRLSEDRARAVANALIGRGVASNRIYVAGRGESMPIAGNDSEEGRSRNRRVEILLRPITTS